MALKGAITRKDKNAGVTLLAKIVTENKKKSKKVQYPIVVKSKGMTDLECVQIDSAIMRDKINGKNLGDGITDNITGLITRGANDTQISYTIRTMTPNVDISKYISNDGKIIKRPSTDVGDITGMLIMTVQKNNAALSSTFNILLKAYSIDESWSDVGKDTIWAIIKGTNNLSYSQQGYNKINSDMNFVRTMTARDLGIQQYCGNGTTFTVQYSLSDKIGPNKRINDSTGAFTVLKYGDAVNYHNTFPSLSYGIVTMSDISLTKTQVQLGGIKLIVNLMNPDFPEDVDKCRTYEYELKTLSDFLTNTEIVDTAIKPNLYLMHDNLSQSKVWRAVENISISSNTNTFRISIYQNPEAIACSDLGIQPLSQGGQANTTIGASDVTMAYSLMLTDTDASLESAIGAGSYTNLITLNTDASNSSIVNIDIDAAAYRALYASDNSIPTSFKLVSSIETDKFKGEGAMYTVSCIIEISI